MTDAPKSTNMLRRFFKGEYMGHANVTETWTKLFVLSEDGTFYCEYLNFMMPAKVNLKFDFVNFKAEDYKWGGLSINDRN